LFLIDFSSACSNHHACIYTYDALPLGLTSKRARRQILAYGWNKVGPIIRAGMDPEKLISAR